MPITLAMKERQKSTSRTIFTSMMATVRYTGLLIRAKNKIKLMMVATRTKMPAKSPLLALAQSTEYWCLDLRTDDDPFELLWLLWMLLSSLADKFFHMT